MKKILTTLGVGVLILGMTSATTSDSQLSKPSYAAAPDKQIIEQLSEAHSVQNLKFTQAKSCTALDTMLEKYAKESSHQGSFLLKSDYVFLDSVASAWGLTTNGVSVQNEMKMEDMNSSSVDFSQTNIQKTGVDEPEILKTDGKYFYYYNKETQKISIFSSPLNIEKAKLNPENLTLVKEVELNEKFKNAELFLSKNRLIIMGTFHNSGQNYYSRLRDNDRTIIAIYDTSNIKDLKMLKFENLPGSYKDARLIEDELYVISEEGLNRWWWKRKYHNFESAFARIETTSQGEVKHPLECDQISYVLPEDKNLNLNPTFSLIFSMDIRNTNKKTETTALLAPKGEIHMSQNALYLASNFYTYDKWNCPKDMFCPTPYFKSWTQTLIHKFNRKGLQMNYENSAIIPGELLTQYSMDEDNKGYFRILTKTRSPKATHLYILKPDLTFAGKLENIEPDEDFKSSRYMWDKLYLVTFEQIDPLFVIDLAEASKPKIIGELKIPGYSTYLHPRKREGSKQFLLGLGYNTESNGRGGVRNAGVKLSLFQIDYAKKQGEMIEVKELDSINQGGKNSTSEALHNPRLFVIDKKGAITLPLQLVSRKEYGKTCRIEYDEKDSIVEKECDPIIEPSEYFIGIKKFEITAKNKIKETFAKNYFPLLVNKHNKELAKDMKGALKLIWNKIKSHKNKWEQLKDLWYEIRPNELLSQMRVGYAGDALYNFNSSFVDFIFPNQTSKTIWFKKEDKKTEIIETATEEVIEEVVN